MHIRQLSMSETIFTHYDEKTGEKTVFASGSLVTSVKQKVLNNELEILKIPVDENFAELYLTHRGIEPHRLARLKPEHLLDPITIILMNDKSLLMVEGNHRYVKHWQLGMKECLGVIVPKRIWRNFVITDLPEGSAEMLLKRFSGIF